MHADNVCNFNIGNHCYHIICVFFISVCTCRNYHIVLKLIVCLLSLKAEMIFVRPIEFWILKVKDTEKHVAGTWWMNARRKSNKQWKQIAGVLEAVKAGHKRVETWVRV